MHYGFHSISTALVELVLLQARKDVTFHRARATNALCGGEELSQSLARPESIGVLACEAVHSETFIPKRKSSLPQYWRGCAAIRVAPALPIAYKCKT
jgi:hypothetical protein